MNSKLVPKTIVVIAVILFLFNNIPLAEAKISKKNVLGLVGANLIGLLAINVFKLPNTPAKFGCMIGINAGYLFDKKNRTRSVILGGIGGTLIGDVLYKREEDRIRKSLGLLPRTSRKKK